MMWPSVCPSLTRVQLFVTPSAIVHQALSIDIPGKNTEVARLFPSFRGSFNIGIEPGHLWQG